MRDKIFQIIEDSMNDWPVELTGVNDFILNVERFIGSDITKLSIQKRLENIDYSKHAWESESLTQLLEIYEICDNSLSLNQIIELENI